MLTAQKRRRRTRTPAEDDLYRVGTVAIIMRMLKLPDGRIRILVQGLVARAHRLLHPDRALSSRRRSRASRSRAPKEPSPGDRGPDAQRQAEPRPRRRPRQEHLARGHGHRRQPRRSGAAGRPRGVATSTSSSRRRRRSWRRSIPIERLQRVNDLPGARDQRARPCSRRSPRRRSGEMDKSQREYFLRQQLKAIQPELGEGEELAEEIDELPQEDRREADPAPRRSEEVEKQIKRLERIASRLRRDVDHPHLSRLDDRPALGRACRRTITTSSAPATILDEDHYDLEKIKERILEYLAVRKLEAEDEGPDPLLRRPSRRRQDLARPLDRPRARPQVRAHLARRRARRGGDPRPSPHLRRRAARPHHPGHPPGRDAAIRSSCSTRSTRSAPTTAAIRRRRCSRCSIRSRTSASATTTSASPTTSRT